MKIWLACKGNESYFLFRQSSQEYIRLVFHENHTLSIFSKLPGTIVQSNYQIGFLLTNNIISRLNRNIITAQKHSSHTPRKLGFLIRTVDEAKNDARTLSKQNIIKGHFCSKTASLQAANLIRSDKVIHELELLRNPIFPHIVAAAAITLYVCHSLLL